jgi:SPP1 family predicted phage head-tail adaptor
MLKTIGQKTQWIVTESSVETADAEGQPVQVWTPLSSTWAAFEFLSGRELEAAQKINAEISAKFVIAIRRDITEKMRVRWKSPIASADQYWNIHSLRPGEDRMDMELMVGKVM